MPSPFPGMDPFLESPDLWPAFQHRLVVALHEHILPALGGRYKARIGERRYTTEPAAGAGGERRESGADGLSGVRRRVS